MAFGKNKKKNKKRERDAAVKQQMMQMSQNPLYPEKKENTLKDVLSALGTAAVCLILVGFITVNFSYSFGNVKANDDYEMNEDISGDDGALAEGNAVTENESEDSFDDVSDEAWEEEMEDASADEAEDYEASVADGDYILWDSDSRYISESELNGLSKEELSYARNEIYARHGRRFKDEALQRHFDSKDWYAGTIEPEDFSESMLNDYEIKNAETILSYEKAKGYR